MRPALLAPLLLAACAPVGAPGGAVFETPMRLVGTEPFWGGTVSDALITVEGADRPSLRMPAGERRVTGAGVSWRTRTAAGSPTEVVVTLTPETCSDGMSDRVYPFRAEVALGAEVLRGCAIPERLWPRAAP